MTSVGRCVGKSDGLYPRSSIHAFSKLSIDNSARNKRQSRAVSDKIERINTKLSVEHGPRHTILFFDILMCIFVLPNK